MIEKTLQHFTQNEKTEPYQTHQRRQFFCVEIAYCQHAMQPCVHVHCWSSKRNFPKSYQLDRTEAETKTRTGLVQWTWGVISCKLKWSCELPCADYFFLPSKSEPEVKFLFNPPPPCVQQKHTVGVVGQTKCKLGSGDPPGGLSYLHTQLGDPGLGSMAWRRKQNTRNGGRDRRNVGYMGKSVIYGHLKKTLRLFRSKLARKERSLVQRVSK